jgi:hypothetical protein
MWLNEWGSTRPDIYEMARLSITKGLTQTVIFTVAAPLGYCAARVAAKASSAGQDNLQRAERP